MLDRKLIVFTYAALGVVGAGGALLLGHDPIATKPLLLAGDTAARLALSAGLGLVVAGAAVLSARHFVARFVWAQSLHAELAKVLRGNSDFDLRVIALASGIGEELLFRGLAVPTLGIVASSVLFGLLHQVRGPARWAWALWATLMGILLALLYVATGSLIGPIVAHVVTNAVNLRFVRDHGAPPGPRPLASV